MNGWRGSLAGAGTPKGSVKIVHGSWGRHWSSALQSWVRVSSGYFSDFQCDLEQINLLLTCSFQKLRRGHDTELFTLRSLCCIHVVLKHCGTQYSWISLMGTQRVLLYSCAHRKGMKWKVCCNERKIEWIWDNALDFSGMLNTKKSMLIQHYSLVFKPTC